jgi:hypothetical protein
MMSQSDEALTHANCGGTILRNPQTDRYVCDKCKAEAESVISAGEKVEGRPEEVTLCDPHSQTI